MQLTRAKTLSDQVCDCVRHRILHGHYEAGQVLVEAELAVEFGVSRTPVGNALIMLKERGLIEDAGGKLAVLTLTGQDVFDLYRCRAAFDGLAARQAAERGGSSATDLKELALRLRGQSVGGQQNHERLYLADLSFHRAVYEASLNRSLIRFHDTTSDLLGTYRWTIVDGLRRSGATVRPRPLDQVWHEHLAIADAVLEGDPDRAEAVARNHIENVLAYLMAYRGLAGAVLADAVAPKRSGRKGGGSTDATASSVAHDTRMLE